MTSGGVLESEAENAPTFSPGDLVKAHNELGVYTSASRAILLHLCQRIGRLENSFRTMQNDLFRIRSDLSKGNNDMKDEVSGIQGQVETLSSRLHHVASVVDLFQNEMNNHITQVTTLSTSVQDERERLSAVDVKVDNQRDIFDTRIQELNLKLDEIPRALAALQKPGRDPFAGFTFRAAERDKLSLGKHVDRTEAGQRKGGPFTDLQPFTIPDDMKEKIEMKIRQREASKSASDKRAAMELADAYRRLQLAGYPRVTEIHMHVEQCREDIKRAFEYIRNSNLQLYACCESKVERVDVASLQNELKTLRNRLRDFETRGYGKKGQAVVPSQSQPASDELGTLSAWNLDKYFNQPADKTATNNSSVHVSAAQVPELRVSLLEMAKTLHGLRQQWMKTHTQPLNPVVKQHLDKLIALLNDCYSVTAEDPFDLERIEVYVEKAAKLLGAEFTQQVIRMMMIRDTCNDGSSTDGIVSALDRYARSFTETAGGSIASSPKASPAAQHAVTMRAISDQKKQIEQLRAELEKVVESQRNAEASGSTPGSAPSSSVLTVAVTTDNATASAIDVRFATHQQQLYGLQDQLMLLHRQARQQEEAFSEMARQFDQWKKERTPIGVVTGQRVAGVAPATHAIQHGLPLSAALRRSNSGNINADLDAYLAITAADQSDRLKPQTKLDPLHIQRAGGTGGSVSDVVTPTTGRSTLSVPVPVARNGALHRIQTRAQGMRPKSGIHQGGASNT